MILLRATLFNIIFYGANALACIVCLPGLLLSREGAFVIIRSYVRSIHFLEKYILGLDYEVRGLEHLPKDGSFIVAAKHESAYETFKLHILFDDPAVVLKQELLRIPLWGKFLQRIHPIAIDRSKGRMASQQVIDGAQRVAKEGRPIIIFPQGTRVYTWQTVKDRPYKSGAMRMYAATDMPIIPLALNSGVYWPRKGWIKRPGKVIFEFLPPIPQGRDPETIMPELESRLEGASKALEHEAYATYKYLPAPKEQEQSA
ncbi:MAG: 1-acyl-sn-glycerol-3-phosphate acyltransferase [Rhodospirillales bacterium]|nr:1-acyl-sn-glycerol-3-phosphate acyltransferase [Rhodospirillales bacterium]MCB9995882.1 1-acyl-sn-glycerol-3-phosphate acyltransferase [Rhodospirillales bacterium]